MNFALLSRPRTQAILEGRIKPVGLPVSWFPISNPLGWALPSEERDRSILSGRFVGGEMSLSSFIQAKSQGAPLLALPFFLKRGLVQRSLFCCSDSALTSPEQLRGKRVGLVSYTSSMASWMRGVLDEQYRLSRSSPEWFTLTSLPQRTPLEANLIEIPKEFVAEEIDAREELDGYSHNLDRREVFLISLLQKGELDAIISFQARIASNRIRPLLPTEDNFWSHYRKNGVYPINHIFAMHEDLFRQLPDIGEVLLSTFKEARKLWVDYLPKEKRVEMEQELERLGWDPFAYHLGAVEKMTIETFIDYNLKEKSISQTLRLDELFHKNVIED
jgi:4,5-dihydroxyphthalate decarboxylase